MRDYQEDLRNLGPKEYSSLENLLNGIKRLKTVRNMDDDVLFWYGVSVGLKQHPKEVTNIHKEELNEYFNEHELSQLRIK